ncbi:MAG: beta-lactamase family protein, partial [Cyclobacteriaceae bacterium]|nr:beta-lactamase family protein [Cyclobacteriaceae bacterium]
CHDKINEFLAQGHIIQHVAFPPKGGNSWTIITDKTFFSRNIPNEAHVEMGNLVKQGKKIKKVVFPTKRSTDNSWLILTEDGEFRARNIDDECYQILRNLSQSPFPGKPAPRKIHHVEFTKSGGWLVVADDYHFARNINNEAFLRMNTFRSNKDKIELVTFTPDEKGWSVISNQKFSTVPHDPIRDFEGNLENGIWKRMREIGVPGVSVAVVINDQVVWSTAYGFLKNGDTNAAAHPESFFQAGSVSKVLAAMGAHKMNDLKLIGLNDDIQKKLKNYTIPVQNCANADSIQVVTISKILNHRSGIDGRDVIMTGNNCDKLQGGGYFGYSQSTSVSRLPTLSQILNGDSPANTQKITLAYNTDTIRRSYYSGPAFTVLQKLTEDLTGRNYADWIKINILNPMGMGRSTFTTNPESLYQIDELTWGYYYNTKVNVRNRYPEFAAAGMYSNVQELGNVLITLNNQG